MSTELVNVGEAKFYTVNPLIECVLRDATDCQMNGEYETALRLYDEIIGKEPHNARALHNKANVLDMMGEYSEALRCYDEALECDPYNAELWYNKGVTLKKMGSLDEGTSHIRKGLSLSFGDI
jgi:tetratricopeptide (TPR) repeat protein